MKINLARCMVASVLLAAAGHAGAEDDSKENADHNKKLKGDYAFVAMHSCINSPSGFGPPPLLTALGATTASQTTSQGVITFNGDGTGTIIGRNAATNSTPNTVNPLTQTVFKCALTYQLSGDGAYASEYSCDGQVTLGVGSRIGLTYTTSSVLSAGYLTGKLLVTGNTDLAVESSTYNGVITPRICHRVSTANKIRQ
jgi:hypothetical protein